VERLKLSADEKAIEATVTVTDPGAFAMPWTAIQRFRRTEIGPMIAGVVRSFPPQVRCWPLGVPAFLLYPAQPICLVQTAKKIMMTWQGDQ
jgi:hypothetical protein